jgi:hypothetical protein
MCEIGSYNRRVATWSGIAIEMIWVKLMEDHIKDKIVVS